MKTLALEMSTAQGSIAWREDDEVLFGGRFAADRKHSGAFFESVRQCLKRFGRPEKIIVGLGPGSYAGVRIAIAAAVGLRAASAARLAGIPSICGIDTTARDYCVIGDARRDSFFFGRVRDGRLMAGPSLHSGVELEVKISGSIVPVYASELLPQFPKATLAYPSAGKLAEVARNQAGEIADIRSLEPIYLREPHITVPKASRASAIHQ
jgi:tRNA threonylcarbamoyl adenosine modification protein YeaZ